VAAEDGGLDLERLGGPVVVARPLGAVAPGARGGGCGEGGGRASGRQKEQSGGQGEDEGLHTQIVTLAGVRFH